MSEETMAALGAALKDDETVRALFVDAKGPEDVVRIAGEAGFVITAEELMAATPDLTDAELAGAIGGAGPAANNWTDNPVYVSGFGAFC